MCTTCWRACDACLRGPKQELLEELELLEEGGLL